MIHAESVKTLIENIPRLMALEVRGRVTGVTGPLLRIRGIQAAVGQQVDLWPGTGQPPLAAEVIGIEGDELLLMALKGLEGIGPGCEAVVRGDDTLVAVGDALLGRVIDGLGVPLDGKPLPPLAHRWSLRGTPPSPMERTRIVRQFSTGVRAIDALMPIGQGQRVGIFAGAGVGKSTLLSMIARHSDIDVCVVALIGERGREIREFVEDTLSEELLKGAFQGQDTITVVLHEVEGKKRLAFEGSVTGASEEAPPVGATADGGSPDDSGSGEG